MATDKYLGGTDDPVKKKGLFLDLIGDGMFGVPSVNVARHHRGESTHEEEGVTAMPPSLTPAQTSTQTHRWKVLRVIHPKLIASGALSYSGFHQKQAL